MFQIQEGKGSANDLQALISRLERSLGFRIHGDLEQGVAYMGIDLTSSSLHLGHVFLLETLVLFGRASRRTSVLVIGDFTSIIGDPSGRLSERPVLSREI